MYDTLFLFQISHIEAYLDEGRREVVKERGEEGEKCEEEGRGRKSLFFLVLSEFAEQFVGDTRIDIFLQTLSFLCIQFNYDFV